MGTARVYDPERLKAAAANLMYDSRRDIADYHYIIGFIDSVFRGRGEDEPPKPLTTAELKKMGGKPYYHVSLIGNTCGWKSLDPYTAEHIEETHVFYGKHWLAYPREPKDVPK